VNKIFVIAAMFLLVGCDEPPTQMQRLTQRRTDKLEEICLENVTYYMVPGSGSIDTYSISPKFNKGGSVVTCGEVKTCERCHHEVR